MDEAQEKEPEEGRERKEGRSRERKSEIKRHIETHRDTEAERKEAHDLGSCRAEFRCPSSDLSLIKLDAQPSHVDLWNGNSWSC